MLKRKGYIQVYTGGGKGKTTASLGLAMRASGYGMKTYIGQFMKGQHYGELSAVSDNHYITIEQYGDEKHVRRSEATQKQIDQAIYGLARAKEAMLSGEYDIIVLDEINVAVWFDLISVKDVLVFLASRPGNVEIILTGRHAPEVLIERADLVSEINEVKHYYNEGVTARNGIEK